MSASAATIWSLQVQDEKGHAVLIQLSTTPKQFGRSDESDVRLYSSKVSRRHAEFFLGDNGNAMVRDLGSTNGTFLNGLRIKGERPMGDQDHVSIAHWTFTVQRQSEDNQVPLDDADMEVDNRATAETVVDTPAPPAIDADDLTDAPFKMEDEEEVPDAEELVFDANLDADPAAFSADLADEEAPPAPAAPPAKPPAHPLADLTRLPMAGAPEDEPDDLRSSSGSALLPAIDLNHLDHTPSPVKAPPAAPPPAPSPAAAAAKAPIPPVVPDSRGMTSGEWQDTIRLGRDEDPLSGSAMMGQTLAGQSAGFSTAIGLTPVSETEAKGFDTLTSITRPGLTPALQAEIYEFAERLLPVSSLHKRRRMLLEFAVGNSLAKGIAAIVQHDEHHTEVVAGPADSLENVNFELNRPLIREAARRRQAVFDRQATFHNGAPAVAVCCLLSGDEFLFAMTRPELADEKWLCTVAEAAAFDRIVRKSWVAIERTREKARAALDA